MSKNIAHSPMNRKCLVDVRVDEVAKLCQLYLCNIA